MAVRALVCGLDEWDQEVFDCVEELRAKSLSAVVLLTGIDSIQTAKELQFDVRESVSMEAKCKMQKKKKKKVDSHPALPQRDSTEQRQTSIAMRVNYPEKTVSIPINPKDAENRTAQVVE